MTDTRTAPPQPPCIAFIGGGNMASALIGGLLGRGHPASQIEVVEPWDSARDALRQRFGIDAQAHAGAPLARAQLVVWAVKPQAFQDAAQATAAQVPQALHLSVAAGIPTASIARWLGSERIVRAMPNTPALVGKGITGLFAARAVDAQGRALVERVIATTGQLVWVDAEEQLDAVTALSGSGPAYVFLFLQAMQQAGQDMGLSAAQAYQLAVATFQGAAELAARSDEGPEVLRQRVTSKGGTTHAAITHMQQQRIPEHFIAAMRAAERRARELAQEFGATP
ncbi:pyrroline-5-carboxylate reductase [Pulveribacter suum]|uniref:Pyrroline-5-carboxylate reductase n=1 Tax=Pulveribacter suum TaxID=2116657 RepID=A0A2P1NGZ7_9BURK|nr:pyrroline-5-carboxylate reductase [Pulveribacter suum]AVP56303.1 pyrroline-5-carboxylate reductase [Pulveribacter suum]